MKKTTVCEPADLIRFACDKYNISWNEACPIVNRVTPEYECRTFDYELAEVEEELREYIESAENPAKLNQLSIKADQLLIDFMKDNNLTEFTLTQ